VAITLGSAQGLNNLSPDRPLKEVFALVRCGSQVIQSSLSLCDINGNAGLHEIMTFDEGWHNDIFLTLYDSSGSVIGRTRSHVGAHNPLLDIEPSEGSFHESPIASRQSFSNLSHSSKQLGSVFQVCCRCFRFATCCVPCLSNNAFS